MTRKQGSGRRMHVFKVVGRVKVEGERRYPFRVLGVPLDADLDALAGAIVSAFGFDLDHAYGFFDGKNPYRSDVAYELFRDLERDGSLPAPSAPGLSGELPDEAELALTLALDGVNQSALLREAAAFLTRRLEEEVLPRVPERLREAVRERLTAFAAEALALEEGEEDEAFEVLMPPEMRAMLAQPDGIEQMLATLAPARALLGEGGDLPGLAGMGLAPGAGREERGVRGVPVTEPFGRQEKWTFLFDYGDDWTFDVTYQGLQDAPPRVRLPRVLESVGTAPEQYPEWDE